MRSFSETPKDETWDEEQTMAKQSHIWNHRRTNKELRERHRNETVTRKHITEEGKKRGVGGRGGGGWGLGT